MYVFTYFIQSAFEEVFSPCMWCFLNVSSNNNMTGSEIGGVEFAMFHVICGVHKCSPPSAVLSFNVCLVC